MLQCSWQVVFWSLWVLYFFLLFWTLSTVLRAASYACVQMIDLHERVELVMTAISVSIRVVPTFAFLVPFVCLFVSSVH